MTKHNKSMIHILDPESLIILNEIKHTRNIKPNTYKGYISAAREYTKLHEMNLEQLIQEANNEEKQGIPLKDRKLKQRLADYRQYLHDLNKSSATINTYLAKIKTIYSHYEIIIPNLPFFKENKEYVMSYNDLPTRDEIIQALEVCDDEFKAYILFGLSSGSAKAECLSLTIGMFLKGCEEYTTSNNLNDKINELFNRTDVIPLIYLERIKTNKFYYTCCTPEATHQIMKYLKQRMQYENLTEDSKLFNMSSSLVTTKFTKINDYFGWGRVGYYRKFRSHILRKYNASNLGASMEFIDSIQGRSKGKIHETYFKVDPSNIKNEYMKYMDNVTFDDKFLQKQVTKEESQINTVAPTVQQVVQNNPYKPPIQQSIQPQIIDNNIYLEIGKLQARIEQLERIIYGGKHHG